MIFGADERLTCYRCIRFGKIRLLCVQMIQEFVNLKYPFEHYYLENIRIRSHLFHFTLFTRTISSFQFVLLLITSSDTGNCSSHWALFAVHNGGQNVSQPATIVIAQNKKSSEKTAFVASVVR